MSREQHVAPRIRGATIRDPRLVAGIVLILAATALGGWAFTAMERTEQFYVAGKTTVVGAPIDLDGLSIARVRLAEGIDSAKYLRASDSVLPELVAIRAIGEGELIAWSAVGYSSHLQARPIVVVSDARVPHGLAVGSQVDVWIDRKYYDSPIFDTDESDQVLPGEPTDESSALNGRDESSSSVGMQEDLVEYVQLAKGLEVTGINESSNGLASSSKSGIELMVPVELLPTVLAAQDVPEAIRVVLVPGGRPESP